MDRVIGESDSDDPIRDLFEKHNALFDPEDKNLDFEDLKFDIDSVIFIEKAQGALKEKDDEVITLDRKLAKELLEKGHKLGTEDIVRLKIYKKKEKDLNSYFEGILNDKKEIDKEVMPVRKVMGMKTLTERMSKSIDWMIKNKEDLKGEELPSLEDLEKKLAEFKEVVRKVQDIDDEVTEETTEKK